MRVLEDAGPLWWLLLGGACPCAKVPAFPGWSWGCAPGQKLKAAAGPLGGLSVAVSFVQDQVVLAMSGEADVLSAPDFRALLDAVIDRGHRLVVLDLDQLVFIDAAAMGVIVGAAARLKSMDSQLALRSPSALVHRVLEIAVLSGQIRVEADSPADPFKPEQIWLEPATSGTTPTMRARHRWGMGGVPATNEVVDGALGLVVALARLMVRGADGVSISLRRRGRLATVVASHPSFSRMDVDQYATGEGPCIDASLKGLPSHAGSLDREERWPVFTPKARQLGMSALLSSPLLVGGHPVGALNLYSRTVSAFATEEQELASVLATQASSILTSADPDDLPGTRGDRRAHALRSREVIAQALGVVMERCGLSEQDAFTVLRSISQRSGRPLREGAEEVVASTQAQDNAGRAPAPLSEPHG